MMYRLVTLSVLLVTLGAGCRKNPNKPVESLPPNFVLTAPCAPGNGHPEIAIHPEGIMLAYKMPKRSSGMGIESFHVFDLKTQQEVFNHGVKPWKIPAGRATSDDGEFQVVESDERIHHLPAKDQPPLHGTITVFATGSSKRTVLITKNDHCHNEQGWRLANMGIAIAHHQGMVTVALAGHNANKPGDGSVKIWILNAKDLE